MKSLRTSVTVGWHLALLLLLLAGRPTSGAAAVAAHYAHGQVWITWDVEPSVRSACMSNVTYAVSNNAVIAITNCVPQTYAIWSSPTPFTNTAQATLAGRLFAQEWSATLLTSEIESSFGFRPTGFRIPNGLGGQRTLTTNEGLFVDTVRANFTRYYAVRPWGETSVLSNWLSAPVTATFSLAEPPTCHLQASGQKKSYPIEWFTTWVDGDNNPAARRPDFPLMGNSARRGIAHSFFVMQPKAGLPVTNNVPATLALHSGDNRAQMWLPGENGFDAIGLAPQDGYLIALEDRLWLLIDGEADDVNTRWLGWTRSFDPFTDLMSHPGAPTPWTNNLPASNEVVQTYTLNRLNWTLDWLIAHRGVDPDRVSVAGHSGGSMGGLLWSHAFPSRFSSANLYGNGIGDFPNTYMHWKMQGLRDQNLATTLTNRAGVAVRTRDVVELNTSLSPLRDTPFTRVFMGKREENWIFDDDRDYRGDVIANFRLADTRGPGVALFWDLREHGVEGWTYQNMTNKLANPPNCSPNNTVSISASWGINDLWVPSFTNQFQRDDAANQVRYRAAQSYPAFFNLQARGGHGNPGEIIYTNTVTMALPLPYDTTEPYDGLVTAEDCYPPFTGDKRGTWGGYFDWETNIVETPTNWAAVLFLVGTNSAFNPLEISPNATRVTDVALRRPQQFKPLAGALVTWELRNAANNVLFQSGTSIVGVDDLVTVTNLTIPRDPVRARLILSAPLPAPPCSPAPTFYARLLTNAALELRWVACTNYAYQVETTGNFLQWQPLTSPLAAPPGGGWMTNIVSATDVYQFFRLHVLPLTNSPLPSMPGVYSLHTTHAGIPRHYRLNIPVGYTGAAPAPLALILHGHNQTADTFATLHPGLATHANAQGVILVLPDSTSNERGTGWNDSETTPENPVDDVSFLLALINQVDATLNVDRKRVYAGGFSNGGQMCHWLAGHTTNVFAAIAAVGSAVAGSYGGDVLITNPPPTGPIPALIVNATNDCKRPYWGGLNEDDVLQPPAFASVAHYTNADFCVPVPLMSTNYFVTNNGAISRFAACPNNGLGPMALVTNLVIREHYQLTCTPGTEVLFVTLTDGGHNWPDAADNVGFDANREVLDFFLRHCNCKATGAVETLVVPTAPGLYDLRLCDQGYSRIFRLAIPASYNPAVATPIVFTFHGGGQTMSEFASQHPALFTKCNSEGVILVLPQATIHPQNGRTLWGNKPFEVVVDEVAFFTNLLEHLDAELNLDRKRVYASGFSNGGSLSHYLASTTTGLLAAIAPVCAQTGWNDPVTGLIPTPPPPLEAMPVLMVRGTLDPDRPFNGGPNTDTPPVLCRSATDDTDYWTSADACIGGPVTTSVLNVTTYHYQVCVGTTEVILVAVGGMAHLWPDAADGFNYDANVSVIDFLLQHARP